jgi:hypothetical protein
VLGAALSGVLSIFFTRKLNTYSFPILGSTLLFIFGAVTSSLLRGEGLSNVLTMAMPILFYFLAITLLSAGRDEESLKFIINVVLTFCFSSVLFKLFFGFYYYGLTVENVRYQIVSPAVVLLFSYSVTSFILKIGSYRLLALILSLFVIFISVTRTYIAVFLVVLLFWVICSPFNFNWYWRNYIKGNIKFIFIFILLALVFFIFNVHLLDRWILRLFTGNDLLGINVTALTRIAEIQYQITLLTDNVVDLFFGLGIAAETRFSDEYSHALSVVFRDDYEYIGHGLGHNNFIGILFTGGLIFGGFFLIVLCIEILKSIRLFRRNIERKVHTNYMFLLAWGGSSALAYTVFGLFAGTFGDRVSSFCYGISFGLIFLGRKLGNIHVRT